MAKTTMVKIDGTTLKREILKKWPSLSAASNAIGCADAYFSNIVRREEIPKTKIVVVEGVLGVDPQTYVVQEETQLEMESISEELIDSYYPQDIIDELIRIRQALECICIKNGIYPEWADDGRVK